MLRSIFTQTSYPDGDKFLVVWDPDLVPKKVAEVGHVHMLARMNCLAYSADNLLSRIRTRRLRNGSSIKLREKT